MKLVHQKDKDGRTPLHCAASIGYLEGVQMLLDQSNLDPYQTDSDGFCPIHVASMRGNVDIVKKLLQVSSDSIELKQANAVRTFFMWQPSQTALDVVLSVKHPTTFDQALIWTALKSAGARPAGNSKFPPNRRRKQYSESPNTDKWLQSSDPNVGMAALLMRNMFHMFVICNTTAMYTSILAAIILIWAQLGDLNVMDTALRFALPFLGLALTAMSLGFMAGVYLVVSNLHWLAIVVVIIGIICLVGLLVPFFYFSSQPRNETGRLAHPVDDVC
ncbi:hypothetical protein CK203_111424 [Vitis vinifera]|uniref:PGG domain-containing protein n=1 Tax=Vitis vinifera TaxID=29760 RepID=A0A438CCX5_VITVI|nr:hypothetical protein CK203_111424 [Vitis vinifera]